jgi:CheY-like chemotaxis protein
MSRVVALMDDLFFQMKLAETAKQLGVEVKVAANGDALMGLMESAPKLVIVDLNARSQPLQAIEKVRQNNKDVRVVAFLSHVQTQLAAQAQAAGCTEVLPRSNFTQNLAAILSASKDWVKAGKLKADPSPPFAKDATGFGMTNLNGILQKW